MQILEENSTCLYLSIILHIAIGIKKQYKIRVNFNDEDKKENDGENNFKQEGEEENFKITKYELDDEEDQGNRLYLLQP